MSRQPREASRILDHVGDMHYHCDSCGRVSQVPGKCPNRKCELYGEWMGMCRRVNCEAKKARG